MASLPAVANMGRAINSSIWSGNQSHSSTHGYKSDVNESLPYLTHQPWQLCKDFTSLYFAVPESWEESKEVFCFMELHVIDVGVWPK